MKSKMEAMERRAEFLFKRHAWFETGGGWEGERRQQLHPQRNDSLSQSPLAKSSEVRNPVGRGPRDFQGIEAANSMGGSGALTWWTQNPTNSRALKSFLTEDMITKAHSRRNV